MSQETEKKIPDAGAGTPVEELAQGKDIRLTLIRPPEESTEMKLDLSEVIAGLKRFLALWLALAVGLAGVIAGAGIFLRRAAYAGNVTALIELALADETAEVDVTRLQDAVIVEKAMNNLGLNAKALNDVRRGLSVAGILSDEQYEQQTVYKSLLSKSSVSLETIQSMMAFSTRATRHLVSLDYSELGYDRKTAVRLLNEILLCYREDFEQTHNAAGTVGVTFATADYSAYDYAEAVEAYSTLLENVRAALRDSIYYRETGAHLDGTVDFDAWKAQRGESAPESFRAASTGFTLEDLLSQAEQLRDTDLTDLAAEVNVHSVSGKDTAAEIAHYRWLLAEEERAEKALEERVSVLTASAAAYRREPAVYTGAEQGTLVTSTSSTDAGTTTTSTLTKQVDLDASALPDPATLDPYDTMIAEILDLQKQISVRKTTIRYDRSMLERLEAKQAAGEAGETAEKEKADAMLAAFGAKAEAFLSSLTATLEEYNRDAVKANAVNILVPATAKIPGLTGSGWPRILILTEAVLLLGWLAAGLIYGLKQSNPKKKAHAA